jgi:RNA polymerase sigma-32 factor
MTMHRAADDTRAASMAEERSRGLLDRRAETDLARRYRDSRDPSALARLVGSHQRLVVKIAVEYRGYGLPLNDLVSEGNVGLMQALARFDPERGCRLSTYAMWWIRAAISDYVLRSCSLVRMVTTEAHKKLFFNLRRLKAKYQEPDERQLSPRGVSAIAKELNVPPSDIVLMDRRLGSRDLSINAPAHGSGDAGTEWQDFLVDGSDNQEVATMEADERRKRRAMMLNALGELDRRERHILVHRRLRDRPRKLSELSRDYGISRERVRQIEVRAFKKLKRLMHAAAATGGMLNSDPPG